MMETDALIPLTMANPNTVVVLAGDPKQVPLLPRCMYPSLPHDTVLLDGPPDPFANEQASRSRQILNGPHFLHY